MYLSQKEKKRHPEYEQYIALFEETITQMESGARGRGAPEAIIELKGVWTKLWNFMMQTAPHWLRPILIWAMVYAYCHAKTILSVRVIMPVVYLEK